MRLTNEIKDYIRDIVDSKYKLAKAALEKEEMLEDEKIHADVAKFYEEADAKRDAYAKEHGFIIVDYCNHKRANTATTGYYCPKNETFIQKRQELEAKRSKYLLDLMVTIITGVEDKAQLDSVLDTIAF